MIKSLYVIEKVYAVEYLSTLSANKKLPVEAEAISIPLSFLELLH